MAWTITQSIDEIQAMTMQTDFEIIVVKLVCVSDAGAAGDDLSAAIMEYVSNSFLWAVICVPGTAGDAPDAAVAMQLQDKNSINMFDSGTGAVLETANTFFAGSWNLGMPPPIFGTCTLVCETLGNGNKIDFYLYFAKGM